MDEGEEFKMPSPKRQRTDSVERLPDHSTIPIEAIDPSSTASAIVLEQAGDIGRKVNTAIADQNEILDALMQHVEAEATPNISGGNRSSGATAAGSNAATETTISPEEDPVKEAAVSNQGAVHERVQERQDVRVEGETTEPSTTAEQQNSIRAETDDLERSALQIDGIPTTEAIEPAEDGDQPEWEVDSSPYESSSDSDSSDSTDSSDEDSDNDDDGDADGDYAMLDPEEAARILMQGDLGSDDEGDRSKTKGEGSALKTANEVTEDVPPIPDVTLTDATKIEELGSVEAVVENNVLIRGKVSGEYQVLESGSLLCLHDRTIAGVVAETLGRVQQPLYTVRMRNEQEIKQRGLYEKGTVVYYVPQHSSFVFTQPLKAFKGSDASNFHDEEVGDDEMEFSDDEAEAEHKRKLKLKRQGHSGDVGRGRGVSRGGRWGPRGGNHKLSPLSTDMNSPLYNNGSIEMNYDDVEEGEEGYTPLARPENLHEMMNRNPTIEIPGTSRMPPPPFTDRGRGRGHKRGRGHDKNNRGGRGSFRGNHHHTNRGGSYQQNNQSPTQFYPLSPGAFLPGQFPFTQPPPAPSLAPQNSPYPYSTITSPISPLPKQQFNFNATTLSPQSHSPIFQQQQQQWAQQAPAGFNFNNSAVMQFAQQFQHSQQQQPPPLPPPPSLQQHHQQQQQQQQNNGWHINQAAAAEVQRQLEEMRRTQQGSGQ